MEIKHLSVWLICIYICDVQAINIKLIEKLEKGCDHKMQLDVELVQNYFKSQHSLTFLDFSKDPHSPSFACSMGNIHLPFYVFDDWEKVSFGRKVDDSGLSAYPTSRGFFIKSSFNDVLRLFPVISEFNPRAKMLIHLEQQSFDDAKNLLKTAFDQHGMLGVAVMMFFIDVDKDKSSELTISFCLYNPYMGELNSRQPEFKCFNVTAQNPSFVKIDEFIASQVKNLHQYPLRIDIFEESLVSAPEKDEHGHISHYKFVDGDRIKHLAEIMNFKPIYVTPKEGEKYGIRLSNGTFTGSLAAIENGLADISAIPKFIADYGTKKSLFLDPVGIRTLFFVIQRRAESKLFMISMFDQFDRKASISAFFVCLMFPVIYVTIYKIESKIFRTDQTKTIGRNLVYVFALMNNISSKHSKLTASRLVAATVLFYTLVMSSVFQGTIIKNLNRNECTGKIKTVDELLLEGYKPVMDESIANIFKSQKGSELSNEMNEISQNPNSILTTHLKSFGSVFTSKKTAYLTTNLKTATLDKFYDPDTGENLYESIPETVYEFYIAPMVPKNSPFIETFNYWLMKYLEVGIQQYQLHMAFYEVKKIMIQRIKNGKVSNHNDQVINLHDLMSTFYLYLLLISICGAAFLLELLWSCATKKLSKKHDYFIEFVM